MREKKPDIVIVYNEGSFEEAELSFLEDVVAQYNMSLWAHQRSSYMQASIDFFFPFLEIGISPDIMSEVYRNAVSNGTYDAIKMMLGHIYKKFHKRKICKVQSNGIKKETPNIQFRMGNNCLVLPVDVDNEKFQYVVDRFMEKSAQTMPDVVTYSIYCEEDGSLERKTESDIISDEISRSQKKH